MLGFELTADCSDSLICIEFAHRGHGCVFSCMCVMCNLAQHWMRAQQVTECDSSTSLRGLCFLSFHIKTPFFFYLVLIKPDSAEPLIVGLTCLITGCVHLCQHRHTTRVSNTDTVICLLSTKLRLLIQYNKHTKTDAVSSSNSKTSL